MAPADNVSVNILYVSNDKTQGSHTIMVVSDNLTKVTVSDGQGQNQLYVLNNTRFSLNSIPSYYNIVGFYLTLSQTTGVIKGNEVCLSYTFTDNYVNA